MDSGDKIFEPEKYTYSQYKLWEGDWELIKGYPHAMSPSPKKSHNRFSGKFYRLIGNILESASFKCDCEVFYEIDWVIDEYNVVRPDVMIVCGNSVDEIQTFPPTIILETASPSTIIKDRNTKFSLYEMCGVKYYIMADPQKKSVEVYELFDNKYRQTTTTDFILTQHCIIQIDVFNMWD